MSLSKTFMVILLLSLASLFISCETNYELTPENTSSDSTPTTEGSTPTDDEETSTEGKTRAFGISVSTDNDERFVLHAARMYSKDPTTQDHPSTVNWEYTKDSTNLPMHLNYTRETKCEIDADTFILSGGEHIAPKNAKQLLCWLDADEFDLYFNGVTFNINLPEKICSYVGYSPYWFWVAQPGASTQADTNLNGIGAIVDTSACSDPSSADESHTELPEEITWKYKYDDINCDEGRFTITKKIYKDVQTTSAANPPVTTTECTHTDTETVEFAAGGDRFNCIQGPGKDAELFQDSVEKILVTRSEQGLEQSFEIPSPYSKGLFTNKYISNFSTNGLFVKQENPTDNYYVFDINKVLKDNYYRPVSSWPANSTLKDQVKNPRDKSNNFYAFYCMDSARETIGTILVQIRDWNYRLPNPTYAPQTLPTDPLIALQDELMSFSGGTAAPADFDKIAQTVTSNAMAPSTGYTINRGYTKMDIYWFNDFMTWDDQANGSAPPNTIPIISTSQSTVDETSYYKFPIRIESGDVKKEY